VQKIIKFGADLTKFWQKQVGSFFWYTLYLCCFFLVYGKSAFLFYLFTECITWLLVVDQDFVLPIQLWERLRCRRKTRSNSYREISENLGSVGTLLHFFHAHDWC